MTTLRSDGWSLHERTFDMAKIEAICPHGIGHHQGIHGCDGCCGAMPEDLKDQVTKDE